VGSTVSRNVSGEGIAGIGSFGTLAVTRTTISDNTQSASEGGGLEISGTATIDKSTIRGNHASIAGGLMVNVNSTVTLKDTSVTGNVAPFGGGGAVNAGTLILMGKTVFTGNAIDPQAFGHGGGIWDQGTLEGATAGSGGNVFGNVPDDIFS
jgi:hypothetical protein